MNYLLEGKKYLASTKLEGKIFTTELLNSGVWKDHHLVQFPRSKNGQLKQFAQDLVQTGFEYVQGCGFHNLCG